MAIVTKATARAGRVMRVFGNSIARQVSMALDTCVVGVHSICQLIIEEVAGVPVRNDSQFQGQASPGGSVLGP